MISRRSFVTWGLRAVVVARFLGADLLDAAETISRQAFGDGVPILESLVKGEWYRIACTFAEGLTEVWIFDSEGNRFAGDPDAWTHQGEHNFGIQIPGTEKVRATPILGVDRPLPSDDCSISMAVCEADLTAARDAHWVLSPGEPEASLPPDFVVPPAQASPWIGIGGSVEELRARGSAFRGNISDVRIEGLPGPGDLLEFQPATTLPTRLQFPVGWYEDREVLP